VRSNLSQRLKLLKAYVTQYTRANQVSEQEIRDRGDALNRTLELYQQLSKDKTK